MAQEDLGRVAWPPDAMFFLGAGVAQGLIAAALIARHRRQEWAWSLAVLFAFNGAVATVRALLAAGPLAPCRDCSALAPVVWMWLEPATIPLLAHAFLTYPGKAGWVERHPWLLRLLVFGPVLLLWGVVVVDRAFIVEPPKGVWAARGLLLLTSCPQIAGWCAVLLRGAWLLPRLASPLRHRQFSLLFAAVGLRAAHLAAIHLADSIQGLLAWPASLDWTFVVLAPGMGALPAAAAVAAAWRLERARRASASAQARGIALALGALGLGALLAFLPGPSNFSQGPAWGRLLTHHDLYVLRPAVVWLAVVRPRYADLWPGRWPAALPAAYAAAGTLAATSAFSGLTGPGFLALLALLAAAAAAVLVLWLGRFAQPAKGVAGALALEDAARADGRGREARGRAGPQRRGRAGHSNALRRAARRGWEGPPPGRGWKVGDLLFGRYEVRGLLGKGGAGAAYRCRDLLDGCDVVLKRAAGEDAASRRAAAAEAAALSALRSRHVLRCRAIEPGEAGAPPVLVLDLMPGGSLRDRLERGPLPLAEAQALAADVLRGLAAAHGAGIVHGDLKPANVLFDARGRAVLADFGAARTLPPPDLAGATREPLPPATLRYMAPEQAQGLAPDARSDLYSLAVLLCEALAGAHPLPEGLGGEEARRVVARGGLRPPAGLPAALRRLLRSALATDPARRPASARAMAAALRQAQARPGPRAQARKSRRLRPTPMTSPG